MSWILSRPYLWSALLPLLLTPVAYGQDPNLQGGAEAVNPSEEAVPEYASITSYLEPFLYRGQGKRDPFRPPEIAIPMVQGDLYGPFLPLQRFRVEDLVLKGLFWNVETPKALVMDPKGVTHRIGIKDYIGENFGYVASIREKELVIIQTLEEGGQRYSTTKVMFFKNTRSR